MTEVIALRPLRLDDAPEMVRVLSDPSLYAFTGGEPPTLPDLERRYTAQTRGRSPDGKDLWLNHLIVTGADGQAVGYIQATIPVTGGPAEVAWLVGTPWQGRGYARQAVMLLRDELRAKGVTEVVAHIHPDHQASQHVARHLGMTPTGVVQDGEVRWTGHTAHSV